MGFSFWKSFFKPKPRLGFSDQGRCGTVQYSSEEGTFQLYWEFGGGDVVATIYLPDTDAWELQTGIPLARREAVLDFIGRKTVEQQTSFGKGSFKIEGVYLHIYA